MRCSQCGAKLAKDWSFCPYCGSKIERVETISGIVSKMINDVFNLFTRGETTKRKFTIRIKTNGEEKSKPIKMPKNLIEPEANIHHIGSDINIDIKLDGIKSLKDIYITMMAESMEIRAVSGKKGYFKLINIPPHYHLISKSFNNNTLSIRLRGDY